MVDVDISAISDYQFKNKNILQQAFTHPSYVSGSNSETQNYERMEFLGDAALGLIVAELLIRLYPNENEGDLAKRRAGLVSGEVLTSIARQLNLGNSIIMTAGEELSGGRVNPRNLENTLEALIGALYIDGGLQVAQKFVHQYFLPLVKEMKSPPTDPKTMLQELAQSQGLSIPKYIVTDFSGPAHLPQFTVEVTLATLTASASAGSKKEAERMAAFKLLQLKGDLL